MSAKCDMCGSMNEIERAIEIISAGEIDYSGVFDPAINKDVETIILEALREQAERSKGCCLCGTGKGKLITQPDGTFVRYTRYCDYCGKRLEVEP